MNWYYVELDEKGKVSKCYPAHDVPEGHTGYKVQAASPKLAKVIAQDIYREYSRKKVRDRRAQLKKEGKCRCSRDLPLDSKFLKCDTCRVRGSAHNRAKRKRDRKDPAVRDEEARVATLAVRQRDRKSEIRLETLMEVTRQWQNAPNNGAFTAWIKQQVTLLLLPRNHQ